MESSMNWSRMESFESNITTTNSTHYELAEYVTAWVTLTIGLPSILLAIFALYKLVQADHVSPIYVINLLIADIIQIGSFPVLVAPDSFVIHYINFFGVMASVGFMVCVALERYLLIAFPLWYRFRRNIKLSLIISSFVWTIPFFQLLLFLFVPTQEEKLITYIIFLLLPYPLLLFFLAGTLKALSVAIAVPPVEKQRIIGTLVLVLVNYTVLFVPSVVQGLVWVVTGRDDFNLGEILIQLSPLVDLVLYVFMRRGAKDTLLACFCLTQQDNSQPTIVTDTIGLESTV